MPRCVDCGFLAVEDEYNNETRPANPDCRTKGYHQSSQGKATPAKFFCFMSSDSFPLLQNVQASRSTTTIIGSPELRNVDAIKQEVECDSFCQWRRGKSPAEHEEMTLLQEVDARNKAAREEDRIRMENWRAEDLVWQHSQAEKDEKFAQQLAALEQVWHNQNLEVAKYEAGGTNTQAVWTVIATLVSILSLIVAAIAFLR